jgi:hypothetical protein
VRIPGHVAPRCGHCCAPPCSCRRRSSASRESPRLARVADGQHSPLVASGAFQ